MTFRAPLCILLDRCLICTLFYNAVSICMEGLKTTTKNTKIIRTLIEVRNFLLEYLAEKLPLEVPPSLSLSRNLGSGSRTA